MREDGAVVWEPYTDHEPVEMTLNCEKFWVPAKVKQKNPQPNFARLSGTTEEAKRKRSELESKMDEGIGDETETWEKVVETSLGIAMEVLGEKPQKKHPRPWLEDRKAELDDWDKRLAESKRKDREARWSARQDPINMAKARAMRDRRRELRSVSKDRRNTIKSWEEAWWTSMGNEVSEAHHRGDQGELYRLFGIMKMRGHNGRKDGGEVTVADVETERKAWKLHFEKVSQGRGRVESKVWDTVGKKGDVATWLGETPWDKELEKCVQKMKTRKAAGQDGFVVELLKYGGEKLRHKVYDVVERMARRVESRHRGPTMEKKGKERRQEHMERDNVAKCRHKVVSEGRGVQACAVGRIIR